MTLASIIAIVVSGLLTLSRFFEAGKELWSRFLPRAAAVAIPVVVALIPTIVAMLQGDRTWSDFTSTIIAAAGLLIVNLFPSHEPTSVRLTGRR